MDAKQFLVEFSHISHAPGGIPQLRKLILLYAISGRIAENRPSESVVDYISKINFKLSEKAKERNVRLKKFTGNYAFNFPLSIPSNWVLKKLNDFALINMGQSPRSSSVSSISKNGLPFYQGKTEFGDLFPTPKKWCSEPKKVAIKNDILISVRAPVGPTNIAQEKSCIGRGLTAITAIGDTNHKYLLIVLRALESQVSDLGVGTTFAAIAQKDLQALPIPVPPIEEQARIVKKVNELMALSDKLEAQQKQKRQLQNQLRKTAIQALAEANNSFELKLHWQRLQSNFEELFSTPEDMVDFKGLLLDLAVSGKLLSPDQYKIDSTGTSLLNEIEKLRHKWAEGSFEQELKEAKTMVSKIRKQSIELPTLKLPVHWQWSTFLQISMAVIDCHNKTAPYVGKGIHLVRTTDIRNGKMDLSNTKKITDDTYDYWSRRMPPKPGDIFFTREAPMGEVAIVPENEKICLGQRTMLLRLFPTHINNQFLIYVIQSPSFQKRMGEAAVGMTVKHLRVGGVENLFVPVPPKKEQDLLVSILNQFFALCERLEQQLSTKNTVARNLASATISTLTGINTIQEKAPLKAPKTELIALVALGTNKPNSKDTAPLALILARKDEQMNANDLWQSFGGKIDAFYAQLKIEVAHGWITEPSKAYMLETDEE
tara:strand:+ start:4937 stop:6904 length:1968 start_codon:yes stop_codon:yes gene_type:complete